VSGRSIQLSYAAILFISKALAFFPKTFPTPVSGCSIQLSYAAIY
jgi:hypothetical protein